MTKDADLNVLKFIEKRTNEHKDKVALGMRNESGWLEYTYQGLGLMSRKIAAYLINDLEIKREEKVAIISESRVEFGAAFFASVIAGATFVPLDIKLTIHELSSIMSNCEPSIIFVSKTYFKTALKLKEEIGSIKHIILLDNVLEDAQYKSVHSLPENSQVKFRHRSLSSTCVIIYTSGTTGCPKGVQITFKNLMTQVKDLRTALDKIFKGKHQNIVALSILPMNHLFELTVSFLTFLNFGLSVFYANPLKPREVIETMKARKVNFMCAVPAFYKMLKIQFENAISKKPKFVQTIFKFNYHVVAKLLPFKCVKKLVFKPFHDNLGGNFIGFISGGAPFDPEVGKFFRRIGLDVYPGYGLSEAAPVVSVDYTKNADLKSVGFLMDSLEAKIDSETQELLLRGPQVMKGYYLQEEMTKEVIDEDGWLHTGDMAKFDKTGRLFITGRIKNMIVLPGGKKVFPEEVEAVIETSEFIKEVCVLSTVRQSGEKKGTEEVTAVLVAKDSYYEQYDEKTVEALVLEDVKKKILRVTQYKRPTNIIVRREELPKTTTRKVKRREVKELIEAI